MAGQEQPTTKHHYRAHLISVHFVSGSGSRNDRWEQSQRSCNQIKYSRDQIAEYGFCIYQAKSEHHDVDSKKEIKRGGKHSAFYNLIYYVSLFSFLTFNLIAFVTFIFDSICSVDSLGPDFYLIVSF